MSNDLPRRTDPSVRDETVADANRADAQRADAYRDDVNRDVSYTDANRRADDVDTHRDDTVVMAPVSDGSLRDEVRRREEERFSGFHFGSAFFGWLTAMGAALLLTALVAAIGGALGLAAPEAVEDAAQAAQDNLGGATIIGAIAIGLVLFISYFAGGYVAGRMARFSGVKQGIAVWLWAIIIAVVVAIVTAIAGSQWDILATLDGFPRIPVTPETATLTGILTALGAAIITLVGAILGGAAGMRYHRKVDRVGLGAV
ncbi:hypothetical protein ACFUTX_10425 [Microbacterium sp. NPDC057407]|uniref:hypothetical protein n=1 Tax=Microbacterium sp. NPDC057407 TaxID=3346120 RepID=UPI00366C61EC